MKIGIYGLPLVIPLVITIVIPQLCSEVTIYTFVLMIGASGVILAWESVWDWFKYAVIGLWIHQAMVIRIGVYLAMELYVDHLGSDAAKKFLKDFLIHIVPIFCLLGTMVIYGRSNKEIVLKDIGLSIGGMLVLFCLVWVMEMVNLLENDYFRVVPGKISFFIGIGVMVGVWYVTFVAPWLIQKRKIIKEFVLPKRKV